MSRGEDVGEDAGVVECGLYAIVCVGETSVLRRRGTLDWWPVRPLGSRRQIDAVMRAVMNFDQFQISDNRPPPLPRFSDFGTVHDRSKCDSRTPSPALSALSGRNGHAELPNV